ncbi:hypothetical protein ATCC90586_010661 [Pythium insidiosum]|nr:hypothetical protein ATCC90586_010661 [Pythium insidiosum]
MRFLRGDLDALTQRQARDAAKLADAYAIDEDGLLRYVGAARRRARTHERADRPEDPARLVVPSTLRADVLHLAHDDYQGGHQGVTRTFERLKREYYWQGMYRDVERHVRECIDCSSAKGRPANPGPSPGNVLPERPFQVVSMDFVTPLPASRQGNTSLLLFQDSFSGFVMAKAMSDTSALAVAQAAPR